jgi:hypothetical protein
MLQFASYYMYNQNEWAVPLTTTPTPVERREGGYQAENDSTIPPAREKRPGHSTST